MAVLRACWDLETLEERKSEMAHANNSADCGGKMFGFGPVLSNFVVSIPVDARVICFEEPGTLDRVSTLADWFRSHLRSVQ